MNSIRPKHLCRHEDPRIHFAMVDDGHGLSKVRKIAVERIMSKQSVTKLKNGSKVRYQESKEEPIKTATFIDWVFQDCPLLQENKVCTLTDPSKCKGCVVLPDYVNNAEEMRVMLAPEAKRKMDTLVSAIEGITTDPRDPIWINQVSEMANGFLHRYSPLNNVTEPYILERYREQLDAGTMVIEEHTGRVYSKEANGDELTQCFIRSDRSTQTMRNDLISITALHGNLGELTAILGEWQQEAETNKSTVKGDLQLKVEDLINDGVLTYRKTSDIIDANVRQSEDYQSAKQLERRTKHISLKVYRAFESIGRLVDTLKHEIKSAERERIV